MMRPPWPRSLLWRTFLLITLLLGCSLIAWFQIYRQYAQVPRTRQIAQLVATVINLSRSALLASDSRQRINLLQDLSTLEGIKIIPAEADDQIKPFPHGLQMHIVQEQVRQRLGSFTRFTGELHGQSGFFVSFRVDDSVPEDEYWLMLPAERVERTLATHWIGWAIAAVLFSLLGAWLLVLGIGRQIKALENAAKSIGRGEEIAPIAEEGPEEVATLAKAFNQMYLDLAQLESDRALILAGISHDLRTPLARLRLGIELSGANPEDGAAMAADIEEMDRIIKQFLDFARDQHAEALEQFDLSATLHELVGMYQKHGANIQANIPSEIRVRLRPLAIRRALCNLIDNALRYGGSASLIDISLQHEHKQLLIEIADQGPGIPLDQIARLKRPFTQLETARSNMQGSGLGLAIVERAARMHGGKLELLPRTGGGLRAILQVPASD